jgi:tetratricopeptide (TPR) repeat protein
MEEVYRPVLEYDSYRMAYLAETIEDQPAEYEKLMLKSAAIDPFRYYSLGQYFIERMDEAKAAGYLEKAMHQCPDTVTAANKSGWLIKYYQRNGMTSKAAALADQAAETYSSSGLEAKAELLESTGKYLEALEYFRKMNERYNRPGVLCGVLARYQAKTGDTRYNKEIQTRLRQLFPNGLQRVTAKHFNAAPSQGVRIEEQNFLVTRNGLQEGDIIVALNGTRVDDFEQYCYVRESASAPELDLIVWRNNQYLEVKANPPDHRFGAYFCTYRGQ